MRGWLVVAGLAIASAGAGPGVGVRAASAAPPTLVGLAPVAGDARKAIAIGPAGEVYEPDGAGSWVRRQGGGTAIELTGATASGATVIAAARSGPPFKLTPRGWTAIHLGARARAIVGSGRRALAAVGTQVFALDRQPPGKLADAPGSVSAIAASPTTAVITTDKGLHRLEGTAWKVIKKAPKKIRALVSERWALVDKGALDLQSMKVIAWPSGLSAHEAIGVGDALVVVASHGKKLELVTVKGSKLDREELPLAASASIVGLVADRDGDAVVAARDGTLAVRSAGSWTTTTVRVELSPARPGPAPATSP